MISYPNIIICIQFFKNKNNILLVDISKNKRLSHFY